MNGRVRNCAQIVCALGLVLSVVGQPAWGVGLLQSMDLQIKQGNDTLLSAPIDLTGVLLDGTHHSYLGLTSTGAHAWATIKVDLPTKPQEIDRNFYIEINGTATNQWDDNYGSIASLFGPNGDGKISVHLSNMAFSGVDAINRVEPFHPDDYKGWGDTNPFVYMNRHWEGFIDLPGVIHYDYPLSKQVPKADWLNPGYGYGFAILNSGLNTGFELTGMPDVSGPGEPGMWPILLDPAPMHFGPLTTQAEPGFVDEIGIALNMRDVIIPEPMTAMLVLTGLPLIAIRRRQG